ncbi:MAG: molybdenum cofactor guanylyltransferase [Acidimicrobiales bacterium]
MNRSAGIVLVGGRSSRMGCPKPILEWHGSTLVRRVAGIVARGVDGPVVLVRSRDQSLPPLPEDFEVLDDEVEGRGPLSGLSAGLTALQGRCEVAYVSSTDVPFLHPAFVRRVVGGLGDEVDACVPFVRGFRQPLSAAYRVGLAPLVRSLLNSDRLRVSALLAACRSSELDEAALLADQDLARFDPGLESVTNLNDPDEYREAALRPPPTVRVEWPDERALAGVANPSGALVQAGLSQPARVRAATLGAAAGATETVLGSGLVALLNGDRIRQDPEEPLVEGDLVSFVRADTAP